MALKTEFDSSKLHRTYAYDRLSHAYCDDKGNMYIRHMEYCKELLKCKIWFFFFTIIAKEPRIYCCSYTLISET